MPDVFSVPKPSPDATKSGWGKEPEAAHALQTVLLPSCQYELIRSTGNKRGLFLNSSY